MSYLAAFLAALVLAGCAHLTPDDRFAYEIVAATRDGATVSELVPSQIGSTTRATLGNGARFEGKSSLPDMGGKVIVDLHIEWDEGSTTYQLGTWMRSAVPGHPREQQTFGTEGARTTYRFRVVPLPR